MAAMVAVLAATGIVAPGGRFFSITKSVIHHIIISQGRLKSFPEKKCKVSYSDYHFFYSTLTHNNRPHIKSKIMNNGNSQSKSKLNATDY
jgi:uncharacterized protein YdgA (DUF945 family)